MGGVGDKGARDAFSPGFVSKLNLPDLCGVPLNAGCAFPVGNQGRADGGPARISPCLHRVAYGTDGATVLALIGNNSATAPSGGGVAAQEALSRPAPSEKLLQVHVLVPASAAGSGGRRGGGGGGASGVGGQALHWKPVTTSCQLLVTSASGGNVSEETLAAPAARIGAASCARKQRVFLFGGRGLATSAGRGITDRYSDGGGAGGLDASATSPADKAAYFADLCYVSWHDSDSPLKAKWKAFGPGAGEGAWPAPRAFATLTMLDDKSRMLLHGGQNESGQLGDVHVLRLSPGVSWSTPVLTGVPLRPRASGSAVALAPGAILVFGGRGSDPTAAAARGRGGKGGGGAPAGSLSAGSSGADALAVTLLQLGSGYNECNVIDLGDGAPVEGESEALVPAAGAGAGASSARGRPAARAFDLPPARRWAAQALPLPASVLATRASGGGGGSVLGRLLHDRLKALGRNAAEVLGTAGSAVGAGGSKRGRGAGGGAAALDIDGGPLGSDAWAATLASSCTVALVYGGLTPGKAATPTSSSAAAAADGPRAADDVHLLVLAPRRAWPVLPPARPLSASAATVAAGSTAVLMAAVTTEFGGGKGAGAGAGSSNGVGSSYPVGYDHLFSADGPAGAGAGGKAAAGKPSATQQQQQGQRGRVGSTAAAPLLVAVDGDGSGGAPAPSPTVTAALSAKVQHGMQLVVEAANEARRKGIQLPVPDLVPLSAAAAAGSAAAAAAPSPPSVLPSVATANQQLNSLLAAILAGGVGVGAGGGVGAGSSSSTGSGGVSAAAVRDAVRDSLRELLPTDLRGLLSSALAPLSAEVRDARETAAGSARQMGKLADAVRALQEDASSSSQSADRATKDSLKSLLVAVADVRDAVSGSAPGSLASLLGAQVAELKADVARLRASELQAVRDHASLTQQREDAKAAAARVEGDAAKLRAARDAAAERAAAAEGARDELKAERDALASRLRDKDAELAALRSQLAAVDSAVRALQGYRDVGGIGKGAGAGGK